MNKILIFGFIFLLIVITGIFLLKPAKKCPTDKPYLENGTCVTSCASGKRDDKKCLSTNQNCPSTRPVLSDGICVTSCPATKVNNDGICVTSCPNDKIKDDGVCLTSCPTARPVLSDGVCLTSCPTSKPVVISGACKPCSENTTDDKINDNGVCVDSCPNDRIYAINGFCKPPCNDPTLRYDIEGNCRSVTSTTAINYLSASGAYYGGDPDNSIDKISNYQDTSYAPNIEYDINGNHWISYRITSIVKGFSLLFSKNDDTMDPNTDDNITVTIYKDMDTYTNVSESNKIFQDTFVSSDNKKIAVTRLFNPPISTGKILVHFNRLPYLYDFQIIN